MSERPNPDALLARVQADEARRARGKLKIFFGAAPGVGKTYAMLEAGRRVAKEGVDIVVGYVEPHVRPETASLLLGLDLLHRREVEYRSKKLLEFDLQAALARKPQLILVDELAHTNLMPAGGDALVHAKRWQDVAQLLDAGIDVYTTLNVQHLESVNDLVARITGIIVRETVPDSIFESADEVEFVDLAPDDLIERLREGNVYVADQAQRAVENFFNKGNLIALRELALRRMAERVESQMTSYRREHAIQRTWPAADRMAVCVGPSPSAGDLVRATRRMATSLHAPWVAVHMETAGETPLSEADRQRLEHTLHLAEQLGGDVATLTGQNFAEEVIAYAQAHNVTKIVVGKPKQPRWREWLRGSLVYELTRKCGDIDVYVISGERDASPPERRPPAAPRGNLTGYLGAVAVVALCTGLGFLMLPYFSAPSIIMVYLLGVIAVSLRFGRGPSMLASVLSVAAFDFFFVPPYLTFAVQDTQYLLVFTVMLVTGLVISTLTARLRFQVESARSRERRTAALYAMSRDLVHVTSLPELLESASRHISDVFDSDVFLPLPEPPPGGVYPVRLQNPGSTGPPLAEHDLGVAQWVFDHGERAGFGTDTLPSSSTLFVPMPAHQQRVGVLGVRPRGPSHLGSDQVRLLETFAGQIALAVVRIRSSDEAQKARLQVETERLRSSLLSAVSHDLRTPLAAIAGASSTLVENNGALDAATRRELAGSIYDEAERLNRLVANLLDMTRLEAGALELRREWHSVRELVGSVLHRLAGLLAGREVVTHIPPELPLVQLDELLIHQVLTNLLENAVRYAPRQTPIEIAATLGDGQLVLEVAGGGAGLPAGDLDRVFEKFYRSAPAGTRSGVGLGLAICRGIIELHGGRIWAENRLEGGAVFRFSIPQPARPPLVPPEAPAGSPASIAD